MPSQLPLFYGRLDRPTSCEVISYSQTSGSNLRQALHVRVSFEAVLDMAPRCSLTKLNT